jgi:hypothetical protein
VARVGWWRRRWRKPQVSKPVRRCPRAHLRSVAAGPGAGAARPSVCSSPEPAPIRFEAMRIIHFAS